MAILCFKSSHTLIWLLLMVLTGGSWILHSLFSERQSGVAIAFVLAIAVIKMHLVLGFFMELRFAPKLIKWASDAWLILLLSVLFFLFCI